MTCFLLLQTPSTATLTIVLSTLIFNPPTIFNAGAGRQASVYAHVPFKRPQIILDWGTKNLVQFNASKTQSCSLSHKKSTNIHPIFMNGTSLLNKESFDIVGVVFEHNHSWHGHNTSIVTPAAKKLGFLFRDWRYFRSVNSLRILNNTFSGILLSRLGSGTTIDTKYPRFYPEESHPTLWWPSY